MFRNLPPGSATPSVDEVVRAAEEFAAVGVSTLVTGATGDDPAGWLEKVMGPAMDRLGELQPAAR
jgi:hypothetical protein